MKLSKAEKRALEVLEDGPAWASNASRKRSGSTCDLPGTVNTLTGRRLVDKKLATASYKSWETFTITDAGREALKAADRAGGRRRPPGASE